MGLGHTSNFKGFEDAVYEAQRDEHSLAVWSWDTDIGTDIACGGESARTAVLAYALARDFVSDVGTKRRAPILTPSRYDAIPII
jgi:hypothetical protein